MRRRWRTLRDDLCRWLHEAAGSARYSRPALNALDVKLERYLDIDHGYFIEAGAHDGFTYSNTYYFERCRQWTGLLVEPVPALHARCRRRRTARVAHAALVGPGYSPPTIELEYGDLMTRVPDPRHTPEENARFVELRERHLPHEKPYRFVAPARTLSSLIDEHAPRQVVDLLSLDVEGYEVEALRGLDLARHRPRFICVETWSKPSVDELLAPHYEEVAVLHAEPHLCDMLYRARSVPVHP